MTTNDSNTPKFQANTDDKAPDTSTTPTATGQGEQGAPGAHAVPPTPPTAGTEQGIAETAASAMNTTIHGTQKAVSSVDKALRFIVPIAGVIAVAAGICWAVQPQLAADLLGMPLLKDQPMGLSTQIGDLTAFFLSSGIMILLGWITRQHAWLISAALLYGAAAIFRVMAWSMHGASLPVQTVAAEVLVAAVLLLAAFRYSKSKSRLHR